MMKYQFRMSSAASKSSGFFQQERRERASERQRSSNGQREAIRRLGKGGVSIISRSSWASQIRCLDEANHSSTLDTRQGASTVQVCVHRWTLDLDLLVLIGG
jgi:hypothetical protein